MQLFGLSLPVFLVQFNKLFCIEYTQQGIIRIRDKDTMSCIVNVTLSIILGDTIQDLLRSLHLCIFKYECEYDDLIFSSKKVYRKVKKSIDNFIHDIYSERLKYKHSIKPRILECLLNSAHAKYNNISPSLYHNNTHTLNKICKMTTSLNEIDTYVIDMHHKAIVY